MSELSHFEGMPDKIELDAIMVAARQADDVKDDMKLNAVKGVYHNSETGKVYVFPSILTAHQQLTEELSNGEVTLEYGRIEGDREFCRESAALMFHDSLPPEVQQDRVVKFASVGGTGAVCLAAQLMASVTTKETRVYLSQPSWLNHEPIFRNAGFENIHYYRYYSEQLRDVDIINLKHDVKSAPQGSVLVLQCAGHNPTGCDPTRDQWCEVLDIVRSRDLRVVFDCAYQGLVSGDPDEDAYPVRLFAEGGREFVVCQSYSKIMGLYGERCGCFLAVCRTKAVADRVSQYLVTIVRRTISSPSRYPFRLACKVLSNPTLREQWKGELRAAAERLKSIRRRLCDQLKELNTPGEWQHIVQQRGLFTYLGLTEAQCHRLATKHIFVVAPHGRACIGVLTDDTAVRLAKAINEVVRNEE